MLTRTQKEEQIAELNDKFGRAKSVYVADYRGLNVAAANDLRKRIRKGGAGDFEYRVAKNSVLRRASADLDVAGITEHFEGPTAVAISFEIGRGSPDRKPTRFCQVAGILRKPTGLTRMGQPHLGGPVWLAGVCGEGYRDYGDRDGPDRNWLPDRRQATAGSR